MPTRRIFEVALVVAIATHPAMGLARMWAHKRLATGKQSGFLYSTAKVTLIVA